MTLTEISTKKIEVSKELSAPVEKVFKAWTDPNHMKNWYNKNNSEIHIQQDLRVGGTYSIQVTKGCDEKPVTVSGNYLEIVPNKKLVYSWTNSSEEHYAKDTIVTVEFIDKGNTTLLKLTHTNFATETAFSAHNTGCAKRPQPSCRNICTLGKW